jgi:hypothetical protein
MVGVGASRQAAGHRVEVVKLASGVEEVLTIHIKNLEIEKHRLSKPVKKFVMVELNCSMSDPAEVEISLLANANNFHISARHSELCESSCVVVNSVEIGTLDDEKSEAFDRTKEGGSLNQRRMSL